LLLAVLSVLLFLVLFVDEYVEVTNNSILCGDQATCSPIGGGMGKVDMWCCEGLFFFAPLFANAPANSFPIMSMWA